MLRLFAVALVGLAITAVLVWLLMALGLAALSARLVATPLALVWNFGARRLLVFDRNMPEGTWRLSLGCSMSQCGPPVVNDTTPPVALTPVRQDRTFAILAEREALRDRYRATRDPIADERLLWRAQSFRHLVHLVPGRSILELGCGDMRFTRQLDRVSRAENPLTAARFGPAGAGDAPASVELVALDAFPGVLAGRRFDFIVELDLLDSRNCAEVLDGIHALLAEGGQLVLFESNPWNPWLRLRRLVARLSRKNDPRGLISRPQLYELVSEVGFIRVFAVYTDFVYAPLSRRMIWLLRNLSILAENARLVRRFAGTILLHAQKPPRVHFRPSRSLTDHEQLRGAISVVIPCHNEEMNVGPLIDRLCELYGDYLHEIIPVDDNSKDGTARVLAAYAAADPRIRPVYRTPPNGVGLAISDGIKASTGRWVLSMDCDFQHLLPEIRDMFTGRPKGRRSS